MCVLLWERLQPVQTLALPDLRKGQSVSGHLCGQMSKKPAQLWLGARHSRNCPCLGTWEEAGGRMSTSMGCSDEEM